MFLEDLLFIKWQSRGIAEESGKWKKKQAQLYMRLFM